MSEPYKYVVMAMPRSMSWWLAKFAGFDHDATEGFSEGKWDKQSEGLVDTGLYMNRDAQAAMIGPDTKIAFLHRDTNSVALSLHKKLGLSLIQSDMFAQYCFREMMAFRKKNAFKQVCKDWGPKGEMEFVLSSVVHPLDPKQLHDLSIFFDLQFPPAEEALKTNYDKMADESYVEKCRKELSTIFNIQ